MGMIGVGASSAEGRMVSPRSVSPFRAYRLSARRRSGSSGCFSSFCRAASAVAQLAGGMDAEKMNGRDACRTKSATSALAAIAGVLLCSTYHTLMPTTGSMPGIKAFTAAVFGGIGSVPGAVIGAFLIGLCENLIKSTDYTVFSDAFTFALLIVILVFKPTGLFGEKATDKV